MATPKTKDKPDPAEGGEGQVDLSFLRPLLDFRAGEQKGGASAGDPLGQVRGALQRLCAHAGQDLPQTLLFEGGSADSRLAAALYWAGLLNCATRLDVSLPDFIGRDATPCWNCPPCHRLLTGSHRDLFLLDGRGVSIKIDQVREIRKIVGDPPREQGHRVVIMAEAQQLTIEAANALLKSLEEPCPGTVFVLTVPQRERLLPTLVSRSWVLTLPWPHSGESALADPATQDWGQAFTEFLRSGRDWFSRTGAKGAMGAARMQGLIVYCRAALAASLILRAQSGLAPGSPSNQNQDRGRNQALTLTPHPAANLPLAQLLAAHLDAERGKRLSEALNACEEALAYTVNPAILADWLASRLFIWLEEVRRRERGTVN